jgi:REP element-mobilizing transposase RayT
LKEGYIIRDQEKIHFITATVVDWIDVFTRKTYKDVVMESLKFCIKEKGMLLYGYIIMSNHIHLIVQATGGKLSDLIRDFKKYTAKSILDKIQTETAARSPLTLRTYHKKVPPLREVS